MPESLYQYRWQGLFLLLGLLLVFTGIFINRSEIFQSPTVEIVEDVDGKSSDGGKIVVEVSGSVVSAGVYSLEKSSRINDAISLAGGITEDANKEWMEKYLNLAAVLTDGQKIYIPSQSEVLSANDSNGGTVPSELPVTDYELRININTASQSELETLWGIGPVTAQNIIEQRMYTSVEELLTKGILKQNVYDRNKDLLTIY